MKGYLRSNQRLFQLAPKVTTIGKEGCDLVIQSSSVDQQHALLEYRDQEECFVLQDLNSVHGTYVNDCRVENACVRLSNGDIMRFGNSPAIYELVVDQQQYEQYPPVVRQSAWMQPLTILPDQTPTQILYHGTVLPQLKTCNITTTFGGNSPAGTPPLPRPPPTIRSRPFSAGTRKQFSERTPTIPKSGAGWLNDTNGLMRSSSSTDLLALQEKEQKQLRMQDDLRRLATYEAECRRKDELIDRLYQDMASLQQRYQQTEQPRNSPIAQDVDIMYKLQSLEREVAARREEVNSLKNKINSMRQEDGLTYRADDRVEFNQLKADLDRAQRDRSDAIENVTRLQQELVTAKNASSAELSELRGQLTARDDEINSLKTKIDELDDSSLKEEIQSKELQLTELGAKCEELENVIRDHRQMLDQKANALDSTNADYEKEKEISRVLRDELKQIQGMLHEHESLQGRKMEEQSHITGQLRWLRDQLKELLCDNKSQDDSLNESELSDSDLIELIRKLVDRCNKKKNKIQNLKEKVNGVECSAEYLELLKNHLNEAVASLVSNGFHSRELKLELAATQSKTSLLASQMSGGIQAAFVRLLEAQADWQADIEAALEECGVDTQTTTDGPGVNIRAIYARVSEAEDAKQQLQAKLDEADSVHKTFLDAAIFGLRNELQQQCTNEISRIKSEYEDSLQTAVNDVFTSEYQKREECIKVERERIADLETELMRLNNSMRESEEKSYEYAADTQKAMETIESYKQLESDLRQKIQELETSIASSAEQSQFDAKKAESLSRSEQELSELKEQIKQYALTICMLEEQLNTTATRNKDQNSEINSLKSTIQDLQSRVASAPPPPPTQQLQKVYVPAHSPDVSAMQATLAQLTRDNSEFMKQISEQQDLILALRKDLAGATARLSDVTGELSEAQKQQVEQYRATITQQTNELTSLQQQMVQLSQIIDRQADEIAAVKTEAGKNKAAAAKYKSRLNEKETKIKQTEEAMAEVTKTAVVKQDAAMDEKRVSSELSVLGAQCRGERHEQVIARQREALAELRARMKAMEQGDVPFLTKDEALQQVVILRQQLSDLRSMSTKSGLSSNGGGIHTSNRSAGSTTGSISGDPVQMSSMKELEEAFELSENQYLSLLRAMASSLELQEIGGMRSLANCSQEERHYVTSDRELACQQLSGLVKTLKERINRKDELLSGYEKDLATLRHVENLTEVTSNQASSIMGELRAKAEEVECLRETLRKTKDRLDQEKRLNSAIKQKKTYHLENEHVTRNGWPKHHCVEEDIQAQARLKARNDKLKRSNYETSQMRLLSAESSGKTSDLESSERRSHRRLIPNSDRSVLTN